MNYVLAVVMQFNSGANEVVIKARGRAISKAVDVAEIVRQRFLPEMVEVKEVKIGSEEVGEEQNKRTVSTIDITLRRVS
ncbi:MAG: DNA-binding protein Alba [Candidatus Odinarchaeota archaeon]|nr:DNA-binding protein Alba [Candidatus Odinarchaeota archaeon]